MPPRSRLLILMVRLPLGSPRTPRADKRGLCEVLHRRAYKFQLGCECQPCCDVCVAVKLVAMEIVMTAAKTFTRTLGAAWNTSVMPLAALVHSARVDWFHRLRTAPATRKRGTAGIHTATLASTDSEYTRTDRLRRKSRSVYYLCALVIATVVSWTPSEARQSEPPTLQSQTVRAPDCDHYEDDQFSWLLCQLGEEPR